MAASGVLSWLNQVQEPSPVLSWDHPVASYEALADAPLGNGLELYLMTAFICFLCFLILGRERKK
jgi:hypothetical protein